MGRFTGSGAGRGPLSPSAAIRLAACLIAAPVSSAVTCPSTPGTRSPGTPLSPNPLTGGSHTGTIPAPAPPRTGGPHRPLRYRGTLRSPRPAVAIRSPWIPLTPPPKVSTVFRLRSEEHTSELQSLTNLVCRLLLQKKTHSRPMLRAHSPTRPHRTLKIQVIEFADNWTEGSCLRATSIYGIDRSHLRGS